MPRKKGAAKRRGRRELPDEAALLEMARESLTWKRSDWALALEVAKRTEKAPRARPAARSRIYRKFRKRKEELVQKIRSQDASQEWPVPSGHDPEPARAGKLVPGTPAVPGTN